MTVQRRHAIPRVLLLIVAAAQAEVGLWGEFSPHSFFTTFPGFGHHWVAPLGMYNEHLLRDYASAELGFAVLLGAAALWFERRLVLVAGTALLAGTLPHFAYHLTTTDHLSTTDNVASLVSFVLEMAAVTFAMYAVTTAPVKDKETPPWHASNPARRAASTSSAG